MHSYWLEMFETDSLYIDIFLYFPQDMVRTKLDFEFTAPASAPPRGAQPRRVLKVMYSVAYSGLVYGGSQLMFTQTTV